MRGKSGVSQNFAIEITLLIVFHYDIHILGSDIKLKVMSVVKLDINNYTISLCPLVTWN